jgi:hypothetical protein
MSLHRSLVTAARVLTQLRGDHRTIALMLVVPCVLNGLVAWIFDGTPVFDRIGSSLVGVFPMVVMFIVTSIATLRERQSGTLERLLTTPLGKGDLMLGYALAFGLVVVVQSLLVSGLSVWAFGLDVRGPIGLLLLVALLAGLLGNKDARAFFDAFAFLKPEVFAIPFEADAAAPPDAIAEAARGAGLQAQVCGAIDAALDSALARRPHVLICGSLYLAGEVLAADPETWPS